MTINQSVCPYRGLQPFTEAEYELFAGRARDIQVIISGLYGSKLTILYGESGVGKTSVILAGVLPALAGREHRVAAIVFREWQSADFERKLRRAIFESLAAAMNRVLERPEYVSLQKLEEAFCDALKTGDSSLSLEELYQIPLDRFMVECCAALSGRLFFIFDQFEEYFYYHPAGAFDAALARAVNSREISANFLLSLREDGLGKLDRLRRRIPQLLGNMIRLEHLDRIDVEEAIRHPLQVYESKTGYRAEIREDLVAALIPQIREDQIGFSEEDKLPDWYVTANQDSLRYKAPFLQVVLTQLWNCAVSNGSGGNVQLTLERFQGHRKTTTHATEAMVIVRSYFDEKMSRLSPSEREDAAEVLRFLVRPGGQKKSRTAAQLVRDAGFDNTKIRLEVVTKMLDRLASEDEEFKLLKCVDSLPGAGYEIRHDVMGLALRDWCDRYREIVRDKRQRRSETRRTTWTLIGAAIFIIAAGAIGWGWWMNQKRNLLEQNRKAERLLGTSYSYLEAANRLFNRDLGLLSAIDAIGVYRRSNQLVSPRAGVALALATSYRETKAHAPDDIDRASVLAGLPCVVSADGLNELVLKTRDSVRLRVSDGQIKDRSAGGEIVGLGFALDSKHCGLRLKNGKTIVWSLPNLNRSDTDVPLATALGIREGGVNSWFRVAPPEGWKEVYDEMIDRELLDGISQITGPYPQAERPKIGVPNRVVTDEINDAFTALNSGKIDDAERVLRKVFSSILLDPEKTKAVLATNLFERATRERARNVRENYFRTVVKLDKSFETKIDQFRSTEIQAEGQAKAIELMDLGNRLAAEGKIPDSKEAYRKAIEFDPSLKDKVDPETEWMKFRTSSPSPSPAAQ